MLTLMNLIIDLLLKHWQLGLGLKCDGILVICMAGQALYIVMPFMANGSLHLYLRKHRADL